MFRRQNRLTSALRPQALLNAATLTVITYMLLTYNSSSIRCPEPPVPAQNVSVAHPVNDAVPPAPKPVSHYLESVRARHARDLPSCAASGERAKTYLMVFMGHSGSSAIISELKQHPMIHFEKAELVDHQAKFNTTEALQLTRGVFERGIAQGKTPGFKIRPAHILAQPDNWRALAEEFDTRVIWQYRKNVFKAAVGEYTHRFLNDTSVVEGLRQNISREERCRIGAGCKFRVDNFEFLHKGMQDMVKSQRLISRAVNVIGRGCVRELPYEDYLYSREESLMDLYRFLGIHEIESQPERFKATGDSMCEVIENWDDVCQAFYGCSVWQGMMEDPANGCFCRPTSTKDVYCDP